MTDLSVTSEVTDRGPNFDENGRFIAGNSLSRGRPKGARNRLCEAFIADLEADWKEHGLQVIEAVRETRPQDYLKVIAAILPRDVNVHVSEAQEMSDEQLRERIARLNDIIAPFLGIEGVLRVSDGTAAPAKDETAVHAVSR
jgi:hypothetical protein